MIGVLTSPGQLLLLLAVLGTLLLWVRPGRVGRLMVSLAMLGLAVIAVLPIDQYVLHPLENRFPTPELPGHVDGILVLGGAVEASLWADRGQPSLNADADRMTEFVRLARRYPDATLAFTGGPAPSKPNGPREADVARALFGELGLDTAHMIFEDRSTTTWENAVFTKQLVQPKPGAVWLLVTSASHLPRAVGTFRAVGWEMIPVPVGYKTYNNPALRHKPGLFQRLQQLDTGAHEWIGMVEYWLRGRSTALFPAPRAGSAIVEPGKA